MSPRASNRSKRASRKKTKRQRFNTRVIRRCGASIIKPPLTQTARRFLMFDFDAGKLIIVGIVALIVIGPKELPRVMLQVGQAAAKMRHMAAEFRSQFMDAMREADIEDIKADVGKLAESAKIEAVIDPLAEIKAGITSA